MPNTANWLVETDWLAERLNSPGIVVLDGSLHLPTSGRNAKAEYMAGHIPGALFFDIDEISDRKSTLPHMLPSTVQFASQVKKLGLGDGMRIVAYDSEGFYSAARVWWMFRIMGHEDVAILNGGLRKWKAEGRDIEDGPAAPRQPRHFTPRFNSMLLRDRAEMLDLTRSKAMQIVDARSAERFRGEAAEPRPGLRSGRIPGSLNVPFTSLLNPDGTMRSDAELARTMADAGVDTARPIVTTCGSGVTAGVVAFALARLGHTDAAVYDGSWSEWGLADGPPIETGKG